MRHRLTLRAERDIEDILRETLRTFGNRQVQAYAEIIDRAVAMIVDDPERPSTRSRTELAPGIRSFHMAHASPRRRGASHILYFSVIAERREVVVLRVLHEKMEPRLRVGADMVPADPPQDPCP
ncbi:type II toxin-antitoxin system RelE/ParE family toxin [Methylobacterium sp. J-076]|uniref:type II toxin-antitoxin system RelE/ParE family toxin n=1 Tax=Methylobacterium sp. J-076 TaxID=2836655 RepID=UPI001FBA52FC|nr:type II toxin-antitoxin system RelE/ParE family toxin [Methylobacterium sp. J-076]MCJ2015010.1 type II toxin-antitoxin system RelE/ParE family toxin [Methylobacterium sp. J-076]